MTEHSAPLAAWHAAIAHAIRDHAVDAVPGILVRMARDGWGHEAEEARRQMAAAAAAPRPSMAALLGHDVDAAKQLQLLLEAHRRGGIDRLRDVVSFTEAVASPDAFRLLLVEAVLTLSEQGTGAGQRAAEDFAQAEAAVEREQDRQR